MAENLFQLEIITPRKTVYSAQVESFTAPGTVGGFQVLHSHAPLLSSVEIGVVKLRDVQGNEHRYATSGGFVEVKDNKVVMLAETVERSDEIDVDRATSAKERARQRLEEKKADLNVARAELALRRAINRLKVATRN